MSKKPNNSHIFSTKPNKVIELKTRKVTVKDYTPEDISFHLNELINAIFLLTHKNPRYHDIYFHTRTVSDVNGEYEIKFSLVSEKQKIAPIAEFLEKNCKESVIGGSKVK